MLKEEIKYFIQNIKNMERKILVIFLSVAALQTISWYYASRSFYKWNLYDYFAAWQNSELYEFLYWFTSDFVVLFVIPVLIVKLVFKEKISQYGLKPGDYKTGLKLASLFIVIMLAVIWFASSSESFTGAYPVFNQARDSWRLFLIYECGLFIYMIAWEFIWRGFMLWGLYPKFGIYAVLIQMIPFVILHNGKPALETFGAIAGGILLGILAIRTESIYYCIITHFGVMFCIDFISILRYRANDLGIGVNSLINITKFIFK